MLLCSTAALGGLFIYTEIPALDTITDFQYVFASTFANVQLFAAVLLFCLAPMMFLFHHFFEIGILASGLLLKLIYWMEIIANFYNISLLEDVVES